MGKGFKHGASSVNPLNFKVVNGTSAPTNPKENTIWIETGTEISEYIFSKECPVANLLDFETWAESVSVSGGTKTVSGNLITISSDGSLCNTRTSISCEPGKTYVIQWDYDGVASDALVHLYPNGKTGNGSVIANGDVGRLEYTVTDGVTYFDFLLVVQGNKTATFSNIRISEKGFVTDHIDDGTVWIQTGAVSPIGFNALKKNGIMIYPLAAKQYVNGAWVEKVAKIYQNGEFVDWWNGELYTAGNEYPIVTGGWYGKPWKFTSNVTAAETINIDRGSSYMRMSFDSSLRRRSGVLLTANKIDLSKYNTLTFNGFINQNGYSNSYKADGLVCIFENIGDDTYDKKYVKSADIANSGAAANSTINVSDLSGEYYIGVSLYNYDAAAAFVQMNSMVLS